MKTPFIKTRRFPTASKVVALLLAAVILTPTAALAAPLDKVFGPSDTIDRDGTMMDSAYAVTHIFDSASLLISGATIPHSGQDGSPNHFRTFNAQGSTGKLTINGDVEIDIENSSVQMRPWIYSIFGAATIECVGDTNIDIKDSHVITMMTVMLNGTEGFLDIQDVNISISGNSTLGDTRQGFENDISLSFGPYIGYGTRSGLATVSIGDMNLKLGAGTTVIGPIAGIQSYGANITVGNMTIEATESEINGTLYFAPTVWNYSTDIFTPATGVVGIHTIKLDDCTVTASTRTDIMPYNPFTDKYDIRASINVGGDSYLANTDVAGIVIDVKDSTLVGDIFTGHQVWDNSIATIGDIAISLTDTHLTGSILTSGAVLAAGSTVSTDSVEITLNGETTITGSIYTGAFYTGASVGETSIMITTDAEISLRGGIYMQSWTGATGGPSAVTMEANSKLTIGGNITAEVITGTASSVITLGNWGAQVFTLTADASAFAGTINVGKDSSLVIGAGSKLGVSDATNNTIIRMFDGASINLGNYLVYADVHVLADCSATLDKADNYNGDLRIYGTLKMLDDVGIVGGVLSRATATVYNGGTYDLNYFTWNGQLDGILVEDGGILKNAGSYRHNTEAEGGSTLVGDMGGQTNVNSGVVTIKGDEDTRADGISNIASLEVKGDGTVAGTAAAQVALDTVAKVTTATLNEGGVVETKATGSITAVSVTSGTAETMVVGVTTPTATQTKDTSQISGRYRNSAIVLYDVEVDHTVASEPTGTTLYASTLDVRAEGASVINKLHITDRTSSVISTENANESILTATNGSIIHNDGTINLGSSGQLVMDNGSLLIGSGTFGNEVTINSGATVIVGNSPGQQTYTGSADLNIVSGNSTIRFYADGEGVSGYMEGWGSGSCSNMQMGTGSEVIYDGEMGMNFQIAFSTAYLITLGEMGANVLYVLIQYEDDKSDTEMWDLANYMNANWSQFSGYDVGTQLGTADVSEMYVLWDADKNAIVYTGIIKGLVPEPTTATLGILGLAGLLLRRRRRT